jgi:DNA polymerase I-like protein with 3'-5' exonuclease and polymerase domains
VPDVVEPLLCIHDEILLQIHDIPDIRYWVVAEVKKALTETTKLIVPLEAEGGFGLSWGHAKH